jgi:hypothetical protein
VPVFWTHTHTHIYKCICFVELQYPPNKNKLEKLEHQNYLEIVEHTYLLYPLQIQITNVTSEILMAGTMKLVLWDGAV